MSRKAAGHRTQKPSSEDVLVAALFEEHYKPLVRFARSYLSADEAEDVVQGVFAELLTPSASPRKEVRSWKALLYKGVRYRILDMRKAGARERARLGLHLRDAEDRALKALPDVRGEAAEIARVIMKARFHMSLRERQVHILHHEDGFTVAQMAAFLEKKGETVRALLRKGNHIMREYLRSHGYTSAGKFARAGRGVPVNVRKLDDPRVATHLAQKTPRS